MIEKINESREKIFIINFLLSEEKLISKLADFLLSSEIQSNYINQKSLDQVERFLGSVLEKPCLNYIFQDIESIFEHRDESYSDVTYNLDVEDDNQFVRKHVRRLDGTVGTELYSLISGDMVVRLTEKELRDLVEFVWRYILTKSIATPIVPSSSVDSYKLWWCYTQDLELVKYVNMFIEDIESFIEELVEYTMNTDVHVLLYEIQDLPRYSYEELLEEFASTLLSYNTWI